MVKISGLTSTVRLSRYGGGIETEAFIRVRAGFEPGIRGLREKASGRQMAAASFSYASLRLAAFEPRASGWISNETF